MKNKYNKYHFSASIGLLHRLLMEYDKVKGLVTLRFTSVKGGYIMENNRTTANLFKFIVYSAIGIFIFFVPITIGGKSTIPLDHIVTYILKIPHFGPVYAVLLVVLGALMPFYRKTWNKDMTTMVFSFIKLLGIPLVIMGFFNVGPSFLMKPSVMPFIFNKIVIPVITIVPIGAVFLALIICYGLMEFVGVFMQPIMRPIWGTPGRSAIDAVASFVGSYSVALLITNRVYREGMYSHKEAVIIATGFSTVSATFMVIVAKTLGLLPMWNTYFWATVVVTFIVTAITVRLYPIRNKSNEYFQGQEGIKEVDVTKGRFKTALDEAMKTASNADNLGVNIAKNFKDGLIMALNIAPSLISIGIIGILIANHTPVFTILGYIFYPFLALFGYADPVLTGKALAMGIAEMFLPAILVVKSTFGVKLLIAITCVAEVLFFSASIPCMMATDIPISFKDYLIIWLERVILSIIVSTPIVYLIEYMMH